MSKFITTSWKWYKFHLEKFNSASEVVQTCSTRKITAAQFDNMRTVEYGEWRGCSSYQEALDLLKYGYQPTVDKMRGVFKIDRAGEAKRFAFQNTVAGFAPIVPLALKGVPNSMINMTMKPIKTKVVDVYYDSTFSARTDTKDMIATGQKLLGVIVELERQGYRFNLYAVQAYCGHDGLDGMIVKLKSAEQPLDLKRISFPLTHPAFFRVIGFDWYSKVPGGKYRDSYGHALVYEFKKDGEAKKVMETVLGKNSVYIAGTSILRQGVDYIKEVMTNGDSKD